MSNTTQTNTTNISIESFQDFFNKSTNGSNRKHTYNENNTYFQIYISNCEYIKADYNSNELVGLYYENELNDKHHNLFHLNLSLKKLKSWIDNNKVY